MTASASRKVSATTGSSWASSRPMLVYWLPWPGKRKATLPGRGDPAPTALLPRKMPCALNAFHAWGLSKPAALRALASLSCNSPWSPKSITKRSGWFNSAWLGASIGGVQPPSTCRQTSSSLSFRATGDPAPMARMPRTGFLAGAGTAAVMGDTGRGDTGRGDPAPTGMVTSLAGRGDPTPTAVRVSAPWLPGVATPEKRVASLRNMPGTYSSSTTWKLVPPKP